MAKEEWKDKDFRYKDEIMMIKICSYEIMKTMIRKRKRRGKVGGGRKRDYKKRKEEGDI